MAGGVPPPRSGTARRSRTPPSRGGRDDLMVRRGVDFPGGSRLSSLAFRGKRQDGKPATTLFSSLRLTPLRLAPGTARMKVFFRRLARHRPPLTVTLYTRAGCHLCDDAKKPAARAVAATPGATL